ncbi:hypothetical protein N431DRAFT_456743 [Stipitochalara longipes BDJ]|nr:hypothetical protein N431DRAFT_456743 [Stipitochalara longipes BDJ]
MTDLAFARSFLATLDAKPSKISPEHVEDPRTYPARGAYILPRQPLTLAKKIRLAPGAEKSITVSLKSLRNPPLDIELKALPLSTSILGVKEKIAEDSGIAVGKLKVLWEKRPVGDSKTLKDLVGEKDRVEMGIMVLGGGAGASKGKEEVEPKVIGGEIGGGKEVLKSEEFWADLKGYLVGRLKDEAEGERVWGVFKSAVDAER